MCDPTGPPYYAWTLSYETMQVTKAEQASSLKKNYGQLFYDQY